jgi:hypothetical protein
MQLAKQWKPARDVFYSGLLVNPLDGGYSCVSNDGTSAVNTVDLFNLSEFPYESPRPDESPRH